jgi:carbon monoxide dehydrogenase subunit G
VIELAGDYEFAAPQELVWEMSLDPVVLARVMPGCKKLERVADNEFQGQMNIKVGPVQGVFQGTVVLSDLQPPYCFNIVINGRGSAGIVRGEGNLKLEPKGTATMLNYEGTATVSGRIASVGQRLMDSSAKSIVKQSLQNLEKQIQARLEPEPEVRMGTAEISTSPLPIPDAPSQSEFMRNVVKDVIEDLIPDPQQRQLLVSGALVLGLLGLLNLFANLVAWRVAKILQEEE